MRFLFHLIVSHAIFISICAVSLVLETGILFQIEISKGLAAFVFFSALCSYNFHWLLANIASQKSFASILFSHKTNSFFFLAGLAGMLYFLFTSAVNITDAAVAALLTGLYSLPLLPFRPLLFLRKPGIVKTILLAFTWAFVTVYLPVHAAHAVSSTGFILLFVQRFLFMLLLCILFDNRDIASDKVQGLHSIATDISPSGLGWITGTIFLLLFFINFLCSRYAGITIQQTWALQATALAILVVYFFSRKKRGYFFYYFLVDGLMLLSAVLTTVASI